MRNTAYLNLICVALVGLLLTSSSLAESTPVPEGHDDVIEMTDVNQSSPDDAAEHPEEILDLSASAANAALMLREGLNGARYEYWETACAHAYYYYPLKKVTVLMLKTAVGKKLPSPMNRDPVTLQSCPDVPLPFDDQELERERDFNLHGAVYASSPLASVTATLTSHENGKPQDVTVTFDQTEDIRRWSIDDRRPTVEKTSINDGLNFALCNAGRWTLTITATTTGHPQSVQLFSSTFKIVRVQKHMVNQNLFDDNWRIVNSFFNGESDQFLFAYYGSSINPEFISTDRAWYSENIVKSNLLGARVHKAALDSFNKAAEYLTTTYIKVYTPKNIQPRTVLLVKLVGNAGTYVPRFQKNQEYISHHTLGTCVDVNSKIYPNTNREDNHELIGNDVKNNLTYDGYDTDEKGIQYYAFTYSGNYPGHTDRIPNTIINYLLYELAFYRAGFSWGYYYESTCDAMHFSLTELDLVRHMDSEIGLRKIFEYYN